MSVTRGVWRREKSEMKIKNVFLNWSVHPNGDTLDTLTRLIFTEA